MKKLGLIFVPFLALPICSTIALTSCSKSTTPQMSSVGNLKSLSASIGSTGSEFKTVVPYGGEDNKYFLGIFIGDNNEQNPTIKAQIPISNISVTNYAGIVPLTKWGILTAPETSYEATVRVVYDPLKQGEQVYFLLANVKENYNDDYSPYFGYDMGYSNRYVVFGYKSIHGGFPIVVDGASDIYNSFHPMVFGNNINEDWQFSDYWSRLDGRKSDDSNNCCLCSDFTNASNYLEANANVYALVKFNRLTNIERKTLSFSTIINKSLTGIDPLILMPNEKIYFADNVENAAKAGNDCVSTSWSEFILFGMTKPIIVPSRVYDSQTLELFSNKAPNGDICYQYKPNSQTKWTISEFINSRLDIGYIDVEYNDNLFIRNESLSGDETNGFNFDVAQYQEHYGKVIRYQNVTENGVKPLCTFNKPEGKTIDEKKIWFLINPGGDQHDTVDNILGCEFTVEYINSEGKSATADGSFTSEDLIVADVQPLLAAYSLPLDKWATDMGLDIATFQKVNINSVTLKLAETVSSADKVTIQWINK